MLYRGGGGNKTPSDAGIDLLTTKGETIHIHTINCVEFITTGFFSLMGPKTKNMIY